MNSLSWMLYYIGVIPNLKVIFIIFSFLAFCGGVFSIGALFNLGSYMGNKHWENEQTQIARQYNAARRWSVFAIVCMIWFGVSAAVIPTTTTLHLILASELGETVITNPEVIEVFDLLKQELRNRVNSTGE